MIFLDKLLGISLNIETPSCIITEIGLSRGIVVDISRVSTDEYYRSRVIKTITETSCYSIPSLIREEDWSTVALFINPCADVEWDEDSLQKSLTHTLLVSDNILLVKNCERGYPTPQNVRRISYVYIYRFLLKIGVKLTHSSTEKCMDRILSLLQMSDDYLISLVQSRIPCLSKESLASLALSLENVKDRREKDLSTIANIGNDALFKRIQPRTKEEAIVAAVRYYKKDISSFDDNLLTYHQLSTDQFSSDSRSLKLVQNSSDVYDVGSHFNPFFSLQMYSKDQLKKLCTDDCLEVSSSDKINYERLQISYTTSRFHVGISHYSPVESNIYLTELSELDSTLYVSYGSYLTTWETYTVPELEYMFKEHKYFYHPSEGSFKRDAIQSLYNISYLLSKRSSFIREKSRKRWASLLKTINSVRVRENDIELHKKTLSDLYASSDEKGKMRIKNVLEGILHLGLFSRGLRNIKDPWPLREVPKFDTKENKSFSAMKLTDLICLIDEEKDSCVLNLPLLMIEPKTHEIRINHDYTRGLSIKDRIEILKTGNDGPSSSCVVTSSGYFIATGYTYLKAIGVTFKEDFSRIKIVL